MEDWVWIKRSNSWKSWKYLDQFFPVTDQYFSFIWKQNISCDSGKPCILSMEHSPGCRHGLPRAWSWKSRPVLRFSAAAMMCCQGGKTPSKRGRFSFYLSVSPALRMDIRMWNVLSSATLGVETNHLWFVSLAWCVCCCCCKQKIWECS